MRDGRADREVAMTEPRSLPPAKSVALVNFEKMLASGKDGALLRFSIGNEYAKVRDWASAVEPLGKAVEQDPQFTAAWKLLARALQENGLIVALLERFGSLISGPDFEVGIARRFNR